MRAAAIPGISLAVVIGAAPTTSEAQVDPDLAVVPSSTITATTSAASPLGTSSATVAAPIEEPLPPEAPPPREAITSTTGLSPGVTPPEPVRIGAVELPRQLGPAWIDAGVGRVRLGLATQLRVEVSSRDGTDGRDTGVAVLVRRLRTTISGRFLDDRLSFATQINTTAGNFELVDMWIDLELWRELRIKVGQFKIPFDWYRLQSFTRLMLADWALTTAWFGGERQFGAMVHDDDGSAPGIDYGIGVFTGQNRRAGHTIRLPELYGEPVRNPSRVDGVGEVDSVHPEIVGNLRYVSRDFSDASLSDLQGGSLRWMVGLGATFDAEPEEARDFRARLASEVWLKAHHVSLVAMGYLGFVDITTRDEVVSGAGGANVQAGYRFAPQLEVSARWAWVGLTQALTDDARDRGQSIIDDATRPEDREELQQQYGEAGSLEWEQELLGGFTFFFVGHSLKWQLDLGWIHRHLRDRAANDIRMRTHIQLAF